MAFCVHQTLVSPEAPTSSRPDDSARLAPEQAEHLGRRTLAYVLAAIAFVSVVSMIFAGLSLGSLVQTLARLGPQPTCAQCQRPERMAVITRGADTVATIVELATLAPERAGDDSLRLYRARLHRGRSFGTDAVVVADSGAVLPLVLRPDSERRSRVVGRLFVEGVDHPVPVFNP